MRRLAVLLALGLPLLAPPPAVAGDAPAATPEQVEAVLAAIKSGDQVALESLVGGKESDCWLMADELWERGEFDAAETWARANPKKDKKALLDYLAAERKHPYDRTGRRTMEAVVTLLQAGKSDEALAALDAVHLTQPSVSAVRLESVRARYFQIVKKPAGVVEANGRAGEMAKRLGWLAHAYVNFSDAGQTALNAQDFTAAVRWLSAGVEAAAALEEPELVAYMRSTLAIALGEVGEPRNAIEMNIRAKEWYEAHGDRTSAAAILGNLGNAYIQLGELRKALEIQQTALKVKEDLGDEAGAAATLGNISAIYKLRGDLRPALDAVSRAQTRMKAVGDESGSARMLSEVGNLQLSLGRVADAISTLGGALQLSRGLGDAMGTATALNGLGYLYADLGDTEKALSLQAEALKLFEAAGNKAHVRATLGALAYVYLVRDRWPEAIPFLERALPLAEEMEDKEGVATSLDQLGLAYGESGQAAKGLDFLGRALAMARQVGSRSVEASALANQGAIRVLTKEYPAAVAALEQASRLADAGGYTYITWSILEDLARAQLGLNRPPDAIATLKRAVAVFDARSLGLGDEQSAGSRGRWSRVFDLGTRAAMAAKRPEEALFFLESGRAGALRESLGQIEALREAVLPDDLRHAEAEARAAEAGVARRTREASERDPKADLTALKKELNAARDKVREVVEGIQRAAKAGAAVLYSAPIGLPALQALLAPSDAMVLYSVSEEVSVALVVTRSAARLVPLGSAEDIRAAAERLTGRDGPADDPAAVVTLRKLVLDPLALAPPTTRVLVSASGPLSYVPFALLVGDREVVLEPSGTTLSLLAASERAGGGGVLALGDPAYDANAHADARAVYGAGFTLSRLPASAEEAKAVGDVVLLGEDASEARLREALAKRPRWRSVHFACHGLVDPERPTFSSLALAPTEQDDGYLTGIEVVRMHIPADLVVLSGCETGKGKIYAGEGIFGLTRAFMLAGAPRVIVSLWKVDDKATRILMEKFYALWNKQGLGAAAALKKAQEFVRDYEEEAVDPEASRAAGRDVKSKQKIYAAPRFWAGWVLWGLPD